MSLGTFHLYMCRIVTRYFGNTTTLLYQRNDSLSNRGTNELATVYMVILKKDKAIRMQL